MRGPEGGEKKGGDRSFDARGVDVEGDGIGFDRDGPCAGLGDGKPGGDVGVGRNDDFISRPAVERAELEMERVQTVGHTDTVRGITISRVFLFKRRHFLAEDQAAGSHEPEVGFIQLRLQLVIGSGEVLERD